MKHKTLNERWRQRQRCVTNNYRFHVSFSWKMFCNVCKMFLNSREQVRRVSEEKGMGNLYRSSSNPGLIHYQNLWVGEEFDACGAHRHKVRVCWRRLLVDVMKSCYLSSNLTENVGEKTRERVSRIRTKCRLNFNFHPFRNRHRGSSLISPPSNCQIKIIARLESASRHPSSEIVDYCRPSVKTRKIRSRTMKTMGASLVDHQSFRKTFNFHRGERFYPYSWDELSIEQLSRAALEFIDCVSDSVSCVFHSRSHNLAHHFYSSPHFSTLPEREFRLNFCQSHCVYIKIMFSLPMGVEK